MTASWLAVRANVACPYCHARRGASCVGVNGMKWVARVHMERRGEYNLAKQEASA